MYLKTRKEWQANFFCEWVLAKEIFDLLCEYCKENGKEMPKNKIKKRFFFAISKNRKEIRKKSQKKKLRNGLIKLFPADHQDIGER